MLIELICQVLPDARGGSSDPNVLTLVVGFGCPSSDEGDECVECEQTCDKEKHGLLIRYL